MMRRQLNETNMTMWYKKAMKKNAYFLPFMESCAQEGSVDSLTENLEYFKQDMMVDMLECMRKDGMTYVYSNVSHIFQHFVSDKVDNWAKRALLKAKRKKLCQVSICP